jgi:hypothetical protein
VTFVKDKLRTKNHSNFIIHDRKSINKPPTAKNITQVKHLGIQGTRTLKQCDMLSAKTNHKHARHPEETCQSQARDQYQNATSKQTHTPNQISISSLSGEGEWTGDIPQAPVWMKSVDVLFCCGTVRYEPRLHGACDQDSLFPQLAPAS